MSNALRTCTIRLAFLAAITSSLVIAPRLLAQEDVTRTQALVGVEAKEAVTPTVDNVSAEVNGKKTRLTSINKVIPTGAQIALLIDDGLRESVGRQLNDLKGFVQALPPGTEIFIGYMQNGRIVPVQDFTTEYATAAKAIRLPQGAPGTSASPYFCLSDFVKHWPAPEGARFKARFVMMITNGVDPYNGSVSPLNQTSPYVDAAIRDSQRAGVAVSSIYYADAGIRGGAASFSGQSYLSQVAEATGGRLYYQGTGNPVSMSPFLQEFSRAVAETYIATFPAPERKSDLVRIKLSTSLRGAKLRYPQQVMPGAMQTDTAQ